MKNNFLNILYQSDNNYADITGVSIISLFENNKDITLNVFILDDKISVSNKSKIKKIGEKYNQKVSFIQSDAILNKLKELNIPKYKNSYTTYFKLFLMNTFPNNIKSILLLDGDTIINSSLLKLCDFNFSNKIIAAAGEPSMVPSYKKLLGLESKDKYYNFGVAYFNVELWKKDNYEEKILKYIKNHPNGYVAADQDILNVALKGEIKTLSPTYNFSAAFDIYGVENVFKMFSLNKENYFSLEKVIQIRKEPVIYHSMGSFTGRPWTKNNIHPHNDLYDKYLSISAWSKNEKRDCKLNYIFKIQKICYLIFPRIIYIFIHKYILSLWLINNYKKLSR